MRAVLAAEDLSLALDAVADARHLQWQSAQLAIAH
jgi:hypothetical protein